MVPEVRGSPPNKKTVFGGLLCHAQNKSPSEYVFSLEGFFYIWELCCINIYHIEDGWIACKKSSSVHGGFVPCK